MGSMAHPDGPGYGVGPDLTPEAEAMWKRWTETGELSPVIEPMNNELYPHIPKSTLREPPR